jgi:hypothetical protein
MTLPTDDDLRDRVRDLGRAEEAGAPPFRRMIDAPSGVARPRAGGWLRPASAVLGVCAIAAAVAWWRPATHDGEGRPPSPMASALDAPDDWGALPTDGLLREPSAQTGDDVERLAREIDGLLRPR